MCCLFLGVRVVAPPNGVEGGDLNNCVLVALWGPALGPCGIFVVPLLLKPCMSVSIGSKNIYIRKTTFFPLDKVKVKNQYFIIDLMT
jgi:hypothetical protein